MTKIEIGQTIFAQIKAYISEKGGSMASSKFPPDFPISRKSCYNIRSGKWTVQLLERLPFKTIQIEFHIQNQEK